MPKKLKVGVVGCGQIAQISHLPYLRELPQFEIGALCDLSAQVINSLGEQYGVAKRFTDYHEMLKDDELDAILVLNKNHAGPSIAAMEAGKHVLVEKPLAFNLKQADEVLAAAKRNHVTLMVAYMKRYDPGFELAQKMVSEMEHIHMIRVHEFAGTYQINHEIYDLVSATDLDADVLEALNKTDQADLLADIGPQRTDLWHAHDIMIHLCIHDINALNGLYGLPDEILSAELYDETIVTSAMKYENGVRCMWESGNLVSLVDWDEKINVYGSDRRLEIQFPFPYLKNAATLLNIEENEGDRAVRKQIVTSYEEAFKREWRHFYDCVINDQQPRTSGAEARRDLEFAVELMKAAID
jgi:predicted dehydrogenase